MILSILRKQGESAVFKEFDRINGAIKIYDEEVKVRVCFNAQAREYYSANKRLYGLSVTRTGDYNINQNYSNMCKIINRDKSCYGEYRCDSDFNYVYADICTSHGIITIVYDVSMRNMHKAYDIFKMVKSLYTEFFNARHQLIDGVKR